MQIIYPNQSKICMGKITFCDIYYLIREGSKNKKIKKWSRDHIGDGGPLGQNWLPGYIDFKNDP